MVLTPCEFLRSPLHNKQFQQTASLRSDDVFPTISSVLAMRVLIVVAACCSIAACSRSEGPGDPGPVDCLFAEGKNSVSVVIKEGCAQCSVEDAELAADGYLDSSARVRVGASENDAGIVLRIAATDPAFEYPANHGVFMFWSNPVGGWCTTFRYYRRGVLQDNGINGSGCIHSSPGTSGGEGGSSPGPFDTVEIEISSAESSGTTELWVDEVCAETP